MNSIILQGAAHILDLACYEYVVFKKSSFYS